MASHNQIVALRPRTLANVLLDLSEARSDWEQALKDAERADRENDPRAESLAGDRMSGADARLDELRDEWDRKLRLCTGLSWKHMLRAQEACLI